MARHLNVGGTGARAWRSIAQCLQQPLPRAPRGLMPQALLFFFHRGSRSWRQHAIRRPHVVTERGQEALQFTAFRARQAKVIGRPRSDEGSTAA